MFCSWRPEENEIPAVFYGTSTKESPPMTTTRTTLWDGISNMPRESIWDQMGNKPDLMPTRPPPPPRLTEMMEMEEEEEAEVTKTMRRRRPQKLTLPKTWPSMFLKNLAKKVRNAASPRLAMGAMDDHEDENETSVMTSPRYLEELKRSSGKTKSFGGEFVDPGTFRNGFFKAIKSTSRDLSKTMDQGGVLKKRPKPFDWRGNAKRGGGAAHSNTVHWMAMTAGGGGSSKANKAAGKTKLWPAAGRALNRQRPNTTTTRRRIPVLKKKLVRKVRGRRGGRRMRT